MSEVFECIDTGKADALNQLLDSDSTLANQMKENISPLQYAISKNKYACALSLLMHGANAELLAQSVISPYVQRLLKAYQEKEVAERSRLFGELLVEADDELFEFILKNHFILIQENNLYFDSKNLSTQQKINLELRLSKIQLKILSDNNEKKSVEAVLSLAKRNYSNDGLSNLPPDIYNLILTSGFLSIADFHHLNSVSPVMHTLQSHFDVSETKKEDKKLKDSALEIDEKIRIAEDKLAMNQIVQIMNKNTKNRFKGYEISRYPSYPYESFGVSLGVSAVVCLVVCCLVVPWIVLFAPITVPTMLLISGAVFLASFLLPLMGIELPIMSVNSTYHYGAESPLSHLPEKATQEINQLKEKLHDKTIAKSIDEGVNNAISINQHCTFLYQKIAAKQEHLYLPKLKIDKGKNDVMKEALAKKALVAARKPVASKKQTGFFAPAPAEGSPKIDVSAVSGAPQPSRAMGSK